MRGNKLSKRRCKPYSKSKFPNAIRSPASRYAIPQVDSRPPHSIFVQLIIAHISPCPHACRRFPGHQVRYSIAPHRTHRTIPCSRSSLSTDFSIDPSPPLLSHSITPLPTRNPPLLPFRTIKHTLPELPIDLIMRLAKPASKLLPALRSNLLPLHITLEILRADPAGVQFPKEAHEGFHFALFLR